MAGPCTLSKLSSGPGTKHLLAAAVHPMHPASASCVSLHPEQVQFMYSQSTRAKAWEVRIIGSVFQKHTLNQNDTLKVETDYMRDPTSISMACKEAQILDFYSDG